MVLSDALAASVTTDSVVDTIREKIAKVIGNVGHTLEEVAIESLGWLLCITLSQDTNKPTLGVAALWMGRHLVKSFFGKSEKKETKISKIEDWK